MIPVAADLRGENFDKAFLWGRFGNADHILLCGHGMRYIMIAA